MNFYKSDFKIVFAHPDDEVLWASSILEYSKETIICFSESPRFDSISEGRKKAFLDFPLKNVINLEIEESDTFKMGNWRNPQLTDYGIYCKSGYTNYKKRYEELYDALKVRFKKNDVVVTHNPWGEYGHEEHILVHSVIAKLSVEIGFKVYVTGYVSNRSIYVMHKTLHRLVPRPIVCETDNNIISLISNHYKKHNIWTFWDDYVWPNYESFFYLSKEINLKSKAHISSEHLNHIFLSENNISFKDIAKFIYLNIRRKK